MRTKQILFIAVLLFIAGQAKTQVHLGVKGGLNAANNKVVSKLSWVGDENTYRLGYHVGIFSTLHLSDKVTVNPELLFSSKGFKTKGINSTPINWQYNYINFPVLMGYKIQDLSILAGPELGFLVKPNDSAFNKFDFGLAAGARYTIMEKVSLGVRYTHGFSSIFPEVQFTDENGQPIEDGQVNFQNRTFQLSVGYTFLRAKE